MKKILLALLFSQFMWAQKAYNPNENIFNKSENQNTPEYEVEADPGGTGGIGGLDPEPVPIDDYIPALVAVGMGMAVYFGRKKYELIK